MQKPKLEKLVCCDTPVVTSKLHSGVDFLTFTLKESEKHSPKEELSKALRALKIITTLGDARRRQQFAGYDLLGARGFCGVGLVQRGPSTKTRPIHAAMIDLPGQALDALRHRGMDDTAILQVFKDWHTSRLDFAIDTTDPEITPAKMIAEWRAGHATCKATSCRELKEKRADGRESHTFYAGSPSSQRMLRVYDKATQMDFVHLKKISGTWTRTELQMRAEAADAAKHWLLAHGIDAGRQLVNGWITFRDPKSRVRDVCRRPIAPWWIKVVGGKKARSV